MKFFDSICVEIVEKVEKAKEAGRKKATEQIPLIVKQIKKYFFNDVCLILIEINQDHVCIIGRTGGHDYKKKYIFYPWIYYINSFREERMAFREAYIEQLEKELPELSVKHEIQKPSTIVLHRSEITKKLNIICNYSGQ